jgi:dTDP-4-amino-4,6-dideoxygalactose transaminase
MKATECVCEEMATLSLHSNMPNQTVDRVIDAIREFFRT